MRLSPRILGGLLPLIAAAALAAGCGDDESASDTVPTTAPATTQGTTERTETEQTGTEQGPGGSATDDSGPSGGTRAPDPARPDSPENDVPPPAGSPAERFEQECQVNPDACR